MTKWEICFKHVTCVSEDEVSVLCESVMGSLTSSWATEGSTRCEKSLKYSRELYKYLNFSKTSLGNFHQILRDPWPPNIKNQRSECTCLSVSPISEISELSNCLIILFRCLDDLLQQGWANSRFSAYSYWWLRDSEKRKHLPQTVGQESPEVRCFSKTQI